MYDTILFDLDGTLLNTLEDLLDATNAALRHFGRPQRTLQELRSFVGNGARNQLRLSLSGREDDPDLDAALEWYKAYYAEHADELRAVCLAQASERARTDEAHGRFTLLMYCDAYLERGVAYMLLDEGGVFLSTNSSPDSRWSFPTPVVGNSPSSRQGVQARRQFLI